jgi:hypothetical protein
VPSSTLCHREPLAGATAADPSVSVCPLLVCPLLVCPVSGSSDVVVGRVRLVVVGFGVDVAVRDAVGVAAVVVAVDVVTVDAVDGCTDELRVGLGDRAGATDPTTFGVLVGVLAVAFVVLVAALVVVLCAPAAVDVGSSTGGAAGVTPADVVGDGAPSSTPAGRGGVTGRPARPASKSAR